MPAPVSEEDHEEKRREVKVMKRDSKYWQGKADEQSRIARQIQRDLFREEEPKKRGELIKKLRAYNIKADQYHRKSTEEFIKETERKLGIRIRRREG